MFKSIWVQAYFKETGKWVTKKVQTGTEIKAVEKGILKKKTVEEEVPIYADKKEWVATGKSDKQIDGKKLNKNINSAMEELHSEGYEIIAITPVISGSYNYDFKAPVINAADRPSFGWGYGFSFTEGVTILAKKIKQTNN